VFAIFQRKPDPISDRARQLEGEIRKLEKEIEKLSARAGDGSGAPRVRSTVRPHGSAPEPVRHEPVFEDMDFTAGGAASGETGTPEHFNELGVRKYDLPAALRRLKSQLLGGDTGNPKLINYLASGSIHGLRPLRYERRVARYRFIVTTLFLLLALYGLCAALWRL
jgi:hypothetical protein